MLKGLYTAYTGMVNEQNRMDILTNNLANASTVGFKKEGSTSQSFDSILTVKIKDQSVGLQNVQKLGTNNPGVKIGENYTDFTQGSFRVTDNTYDLALAGDGFFTIEFTNKAGETSTMYTRNGQFTLNREGYLVGKKIVILGSGDIGLIMARQFVLEGAEVSAVCEIMPYSSGLTRNIVQCIEDYDIPLFFNTTVTRIIGDKRFSFTSLKLLIIFLSLPKATSRPFYKS